MILINLIGFKHGTLFFEIQIIQIDLKLQQRTSGENMIIGGYSSLLVRRRLSLADGLEFVQVDDTRQFDSF